MKYSIRGNLTTADGSVVIGVLNQYPLWRLITEQVKDLNNTDRFNFEVWLSNELDKTILFGNLKPYADLYGGLISWHICTHDEVNPQPCVILEEYRR